MVSLSMCDLLPHPERVLFQEIIPSGGQQSRRTWQPALTSGSAQSGHARLIGEADHSGAESDVGLSPISEVGASAVTATISAFKDGAASDGGRLAIFK